MSQEITPRVAHEIRNQYILGYTSSNQALDGTFRQIKVTVTGFGRPTVRTRNGYYATPTARLDRSDRIADRPPLVLGRRRKCRRVITVPGPHAEILAVLHADLTG